MLAADEHPGAFLEDEVPFAPRAAEAAPASAPPPGPDPLGWFQRWRVPVTALFVVLIALAVALAFGAKPEPPPARAPLGSAPVTAESAGDPPRSASTAPPVDTVASSPPAAPALPATSAATSAGGPAAAPTVPGPASTVITVPASATSAVTSPESSVTGPGPTRPATTVPPVTSVTIPPRPGPRPPPPPAPTTVVPGYATGSTQARGPNDPPFVANPGLVTSAAGQAVRYQIGVSARPGEVLTFSATGLPRGLSIDPATGLVTGTPAKAETTGVQVTVTSSAGSRFTQGFTWAVTR